MKEEVGICVVSKGGEAVEIRWRESGGDLGGTAGGAASGSAPTGLWGSRSL